MVDCASAYIRDHTIESFVIEMQDEVHMPAGAHVEVIAVGVEASTSSVVFFFFWNSSLLSQL